MITIAVAYQKGGVGKTTVTVNLAAAMARQGKSVLVVDLDQQGSISSYLLGKGKIIPDEQDTVYQLLIEEKFVPPMKISKKVHLLPADDSLAAAAMQLPTMLDRERLLSAMLFEHYRDYDYILLDCPPALDLLTINALVACQYVLIPVLTEELSIKSLRMFEDTITRIRKRLNPGLRILSLLPTMYKGSNTHHPEALKEIKADPFFGEYVYAEPVTDRIAYTHASRERSDVSAFDSNLGVYWDKMFKEFEKTLVGSK